MWGFQHAREVDFSFFVSVCLARGARQGSPRSLVTKYPSGRADDERWRSAGWTCAQRSVKLTDDITPGGHVPTVCSLFPVTFLMPPDHAHLFIYIACSFVSALGSTADPWHDGANIFLTFVIPFLRMTQKWQNRSADVRLIFLNRSHPQHSATSSCFCPTLVPQCCWDLHSYWSGGAHYCSLAAAYTDAPVSIVTETSTAAAPTDDVHRVMILQSGIRLYVFGHL